MLRYTHTAVIIFIQHFTSVSNYQLEIAPIIDLYTYNYVSDCIIETTLIIMLQIYLDCGSSACNGNLQQTNNTAWNWLHAIWDHSDSRHQIQSLIAVSSCYHMQPESCQVIFVVFMGSLMVMKGGLSSKWPVFNSQMDNVPS